MYSDANFEPLSPEKAIETYTKESFFYRMFNQLMRACFCPSQLVYARPFLRDIYFAVRTVQARQQRLTGGPSATPYLCYRGGYLGSKDLFKLALNRGKFMQSLGIMSASLALAQALKHKTNAMFVIKVH